MRALRFAALLALLPIACVPLSPHAPTVSSTSGATPSEAAASPMPSPSPMPNLTGTWTHNGGPEPPPGGVETCGSLFRLTMDGDRMTLARNQCGIVESASGTFYANGTAILTGTRTVNGVSEPLTISLAYGRDTSHIYAVHNGTRFWLAPFSGTCPSPSAPCGS
jgi:hypothetical protein